MGILFREIDATNFWQCINLKVAEGQELFVASNIRSIAESKVYPHLVPQAIYNNEELIGFVMYGRSPETVSYWIFRFMIDARFQGKGYGKSALAVLIKKIQNMSGADELFLSFVPGNDFAEKFYAKMGFERTGETNYDGEIIMRMALKEGDNRSLKAIN